MHHLFMLCLSQNQTCKQSYARTLTVQAYNHITTQNRTCINIYDMQSKQTGLQGIQTDYIQTSRTVQSISQNPP